MIFLKNCRTFWCDVYLARFRIRRSPVRGEMVLFSCTYLGLFWVNVGLFWANVHKTLLGVNRIFWNLFLKNCAALLRARIGLVWVYVSFACTFRALLSVCWSRVREHTMKMRALSSLKRVLHQLKRVLHQLKRVLHQLKRVLHQHK